MEIFLIRHALAVSRGQESHDHARPLLPKGRTRFEASVRGAKDLGIRFDQVLVSPTVRTAQTAELLAPLVDGSVISTDDLARTPGSSLLEQIEGECCALVGHEPFLGELAALLVWGDIAEGHRFPFKKGGMLRLTGTAQAGGAKVAGFFSQRQLRALSS